MIDLKNICNSESENASWEITHYPDANKVLLSRFESDDLIPKDNIIMDYEEFDDLINFINRLQKDYPK